MAHHIYKTEAFVLTSRDVGESGRSFLLFTREFGCISASASGVRDMKSKLRYQLQRYSFGTVYVVAGKQGWRLTNGEDFVNLYEQCARETQKFYLIARVFSLLRRLLHGQDKNEALFSVMTGGFSYLRHVAVSDVSLFESVFILRILRCLGYVGTSETTAPFLSTNEWSGEVLSGAAERFKSIVRSINESLKESHL